MQDIILEKGLPLMQEIWIGPLWNIKLKETKKGV